MKTTINNNERIFLIQSVNTLNTISIVCNLSNIPFILAENFDGIKYKISHLWNGKFTRVSKKYLSEMYEANQIDPNNVVNTINIVCLEWFDKVNGNSYFAAYITLNHGCKTEQVIKVPYQYGYGDQYKYAAMKQLKEIGILTDADEFQHIATYCNRKNITLNCVKHLCRKKSQLKNI